MARLDEGDRRHQYSVAWVDGMATSKSLGRGTVLLGDHAFPADLPQRSNPFRLPEQKVRSAPGVGSLFLNDSSIKAFNALRYLRYGPRERVVISDYQSYFFPLDGLERWNVLYGSKGFVQYQFVVPFEGAEVALREFLETLQKRRQRSYLLVLKRFGEGCGMLSFPQPGWTLACDIPVRPGLFELLAELDQWLLERGGRVYLAKDCCLGAKAFRQMYPDWERFVAAKVAADPEGRFESDLSRRLELFRSGS